MSLFASFCLAIVGRMSAASEGADADAGEIHANAPHARHRKVDVVRPRTKRTAVQAAPPHTQGLLLSDNHRTGQVHAPGFAEISTTRAHGPSTKPRTSCSRDSRPALCSLSAVMCSAMNGSTTMLRYSSSARDTWSITAYILRACAFKGGGVAGDENDIPTLACKAASGVLAVFMALAHPETPSKAQTAPMAKRKKGDRSDDLHG